MTAANEQDRMTEITIAPDGRVFVFGLSAGVLDVLSRLNSSDRRVSELRREVHVSRSGACEPKTEAGPA